MKKTLQEVQRGTTSTEFVEWLRFFEIERARGQGDDQAAREEPEFDAENSVACWTAFVRRRKSG